MSDLDAAYTTRYLAAKERLANEFQRSAAEFARGQAGAYVWGRMDAGDRFDSARGDAFPWAYGTVDALLALGVVSYRPAIRDAWESFLAHGEIRDYNGRALDRMPLPVSS